MHFMVGKCQKKHPGSLIYSCLKDRGTQRQFLENICSDDELRSRIFGTFVVIFLACLPLLGFSNIKKWHNCPFLMDFYPKNVT